MSVTDLARFEMRHVASLEALCAFLAEQASGAARPAPVLLAGGTDFMVELSQSGHRPDPLPTVVDISRLDELRGISFDGQRLRIGAAATYRELQRDAVVRERFPLLAEMTHDVGGPTIQARGTLGGNLATASPAADGTCAIAAFDPIIEVQSVRGTRRVALADLQTGYKRSTRAPDEVIVAVEIEAPAPGHAFVWRKVGTRLAQAISKVAFAAVAEIDGDRVTRFGCAMASVAPVTALMPATRALVRGTPLSALTAEAVDAAVAEDVHPIDDIRSTGAYRAHCARAVTQGFLRTLGAPL